MEKTTSLFLLTAMTAFYANARAGLSQEARSSIRKLTEADHRDMMNQPGITSIRKGHSGYIKAAQVTLSYFSRFAIAFVSSSGEDGAKLDRRNAGKMAENVAGTNEYPWMAGDFIKYAGQLNRGDLPGDSHELIALCATRPVFYRISGKKI